jgi:hypothetical protein
MGWLDAALHETAEYPHPETLDTLRASIDPEWIEQALAATGTATLRRRRLPAQQVIWLVLGMALLRDRPIVEVVRKLDLALPDSDGKTKVAPSAIVQARKRVGEQPLQWLFERCSQQWAFDSARSNAWRGLSLFAVDGTNLRVADSDENRDHFGLASGGKRGDSGYPLVRMASLIAVRSHLVAAAAFGPYATSEYAYAKKLWPVIPDDSLTIVDRNYLAAFVVVGLQRGGTNRHWLMRAKKNSKWRVLQSIGRFDKLVEFTVSSEARRKDSALPETFTARAVSYKHPDSKGRQWIVTSLNDPVAYPANELVALYHQRWEIELGYDEIKTHMLERKETIRSQTVVGVRQELWGILLTYNLIRLEMEQIAREADVPPNRISFVTAMRFIRDEWAWCAVASPGSIPKKLQRMRQRIIDFVLPPRRSDRRYPRAVKIKMSNYPRKRRESKKEAVK